MYKVKLEIWSNRKCWKNSASVNGEKIKLFEEEYAVGKGERLDTPRSSEVFDMIVLQWLLQNLKTLDGRGNVFAMDRLGVLHETVGINGLSGCYKCCTALNGARAFGKWWKIQQSFVDESEYTSTWFAKGLYVGILSNWASNNVMKTKVQILPN